MKKVVLLGDSIRQLGYGTIITKYLPKDVEVWQPNDNCRFASYTLRMLFEEKSNIEGADVIHWNNGLWDVTYLFEDGKEFTSLDVYLDTMCRIADILLKYGKKVIFATTTPVRNTNPYNMNETIDRYNAALVPLLKEKGIIINDLNALISEDINANIREDDMIHLTDEGIEKAAKQVGEVISLYL